MGVAQPRLRWSPAPFTDPHAVLKIRSLFGQQRSLVIEHVRGMAVDYACHQRCRNHLAKLRQQHFPQGVAPGNWGAIVANLRIESATAALTARRIRFPTFDIGLSLSLMESGFIERNV